MKKILAVIIVALAVMVVMPKTSKAAVTQNIVITISITSTVSVYVDTLTWNLTGSAFSTQYISAITQVMNDGSVNERFKIQGADSSTSNWIMSATGTAVNQFAIAAIFGDSGAVGPGAGDFAAEDYLNNSTYVVASGTTLHNTVWSATTADDVAPSATRSLFFLFETPTGGYTATPTIGTITLTVSADAL